MDDGFDAFDQDMDSQFNSQLPPQQNMDPNFAPSFNDGNDGFYDASVDASSAPQGQGQGQGQGQFNSAPSYNANFGQQPYVPPPAPSSQASSSSSSSSGGSSNDFASYGNIGSNGQVSSVGKFDDDIPLLEELGINFGDIMARTKNILLPMRSMDAVGDTELTGPLFFVLCLGVCLMGAGKLHFGYIYGFSVVGCLFIYLILNLMSDSGISADKTISILG
jgi:hypothetical protein